MSTYDFTDEYIEINGLGKSSLITEVSGYLVLDIEPRTWDHPGCTEVVDTEVTDCTISLFWDDDQGEHELFMDDDNSDFEMRYAVLEAWGVTDMLCDIEIDHTRIDDGSDDYVDDYTEYMDYDPDC